MRYITYEQYDKNPSKYKVIEVRQDNRTLEVEDA